MSQQITVFDPGNVPDQVVSATLRAMLRCQLNPVKRAEMMPSMWPLSLSLRPAEHRGPVGQAGGNTG